MSADIDSRFWSKVDKSGDCWIRTAGKSDRGYGCFQIGKKNCRAHRVVWEMENDPIPDGLHVLHQCDNPSCVKLDHLFLGTHADNMADMKRKGRSAGASGDRNGARLYPERLKRGTDVANSILDPQKAQEIRRLYNRGCRQVDLASMFGISQPTVSQVVRGVTWREF